MCKLHCHLFVCQRHREQHETNLLNEFGKQLISLTNPVSTLLLQARFDLQQLEESRQRELDRVNALCDHHVSSINQRSQFSKWAKDVIPTKREQLLKTKDGDQQLTRGDYQQIKNLIGQIQEHLHEHHLSTDHLRHKNTTIDSWPTISKAANGWLVCFGTWRFLL